MYKTKRIVLLLSPELLKEIKLAARESAKNLSEYVRSSLVRSLQDRSYLRKTKKLKGLERFRIPLKGLESIRELNQQIEDNYRV